MKIQGLLTAARAALTNTLGQIKMPINGEALSNSDGGLLRQVEQVAVALIAAALFGLIGRFLPFWADVAILVAIACAGWLCLRDDFATGVVSFTAASAFYLLLSQPTLALAAALLSGLAAAAFVCYKQRDNWRLLAVFAPLAFVAATSLTFAVFLALYVYVLPVLHPLTVWFYNISPAASVVSSLAIIGYVSYRQPVNQESYYWLATPVLTLLFALFFFPVHSYIGAFVVVATGLGLSLLSFLRRPQSGELQRSHLVFNVATICGVAFLVLFAVANRWQWFYNYQMANAVSITRHELSEIPTTRNTRLVPLVAAKDYCSQGNHESFTDLGKDPSIIVIKKDNQEKQYWQCLRHPTRLAGHALHYLTGGIEGFVLTDAGTRGRFSDEINENFVFGEDSAFTKAAFYARHPGSVMGKAVVGRSADGKWALLVPYTSRVLHWGGMIPELSGVMVLSNWGFVQDLTPGRAAALYPGVPLYSSELAREYADLWGQESSLWAKHWSGDILEVSETSEEADNRYPFWQNFEVGVRGVIPFEPVGKNQNVLAAIGLVDPATGALDIYFTPRPRDKDISTAGLQQDLTGPRQIVSNVALSHPGMNQIKTVEALLVVSPAKQIFWSTALLQIDKKAYHGYSLNVIYGAHAEDHQDVDSTAQIDAFVAKADKALAPK